MLTDKRGREIWEIVIILIVIVVFLVMVGFIVILKTKGFGEEGILASIKHLLRFGKS